MQKRLEKPYVDVHPMEAELIRPVKFAIVIENNDYST